MSEQNHERPADAMAASYPDTAALGRPDALGEGHVERALWQGSSLALKCERQRQLGIDPPRVLIADRDGSHSMDPEVFQGDAEELEIHNADTAKLNQYIRDQGIMLIINTGGSIEMMQEALENGTVPADATFVGGGNEFWVVKDGRYVRDEAYQEYIENVIGFKREQLHPECQGFIEEMNSGGDGTNRHFQIAFQAYDSAENGAAWARYHQDPQLENYPNPDHDRDHVEPPANKISFDVTGTEADARLASEKLKERLRAMGLERLKVIYTADSYRENQYSLHLQAVDKDDASAYGFALVERQTGGEVLGAVAGDGQNDIQMLVHSGAAGIVVGNRQESLAQAIAELPATRETKHFKIVNRRLIYSDDSSHTAAASLLRGIRALELADELIQNR